MLQKIAVGTPEFSDFADGHCVFVDKTARLAKLVRAGEKYWFYRPQGFGKTTLLTVLEQLFSQGDGAFRGTAIYGHWPVKEKYPVVRISLKDTICDKGQEVFDRSLCRLMGAGFARIEGLDASKYSQVEDSYLLYLYLAIDLIRNNREVVLLIDDCDYPLTASLHNPQQFEEVRDALDLFSRHIQTHPKLFRFVLFTGVARFRESSLFYGQDFTDLSMDQDYADMAGYTEEELRTCFAPHIAEAASRLQITQEQLLEQLRTWYGGFCFDEEGSISLYSPRSINQFFSALQDKNLKPSFSWHQPESPDTLRGMQNLIRRESSVSLDSIETEGDTMLNYDLLLPMYAKEVHLLPMLANKGYLTVKKADLTETNLSLRRYHFNITNLETRKALEQLFLQSKAQD